MHLMLPTAGSELRRGQILAEWGLFRVYPEISYGLAWLKDKCYLFGASDILSRRQFRQTRQQVNGSVQREELYVYDAVRGE